MAPRHPRRGCQIKWPSSPAADSQRLAGADSLLRGADYNLAVRLGRMNGRAKDDVEDGGRELHAGYWAMAVANGVDPEDPALAPCRESSASAQVQPLARIRSTADEPRCDTRGHGTGKALRATTAPQVSTLSA